MIDWSSCPSVERDADRVSGARVFCGTRIPVAALFQNLEDDVPVHQFVEWFPAVTVEQARAVLEHAARSAHAGPETFLSIIESKTRGLGSNGAEAGADPQGAA